MRDILFRGKCVDTGRWYEGQYIHLHKTTHCPIGDLGRFPDNDIHQIVFERMTDWELPNQHLRVDVVPKTVGQFTGLTKNGKKIFEGDIISYIMPDGGSAKGIIKFGEYGTGGSCHVGFGVNWYNRYDTGWLRNDLGFWVKFREIEVIGNIHDNPELLEG